MIIILTISQKLGTIELQVVCSTVELFPELHVLQSTHTKRFHIEQICYNRMPNLSTMEPNVVFNAMELFTNI